jgi:hypothetical protein
MLDGSAEPAIEAEFMARLSSKTFPYRRDIKMDAIRGDLPF